MINPRIKIISQLIIIIILLLSLIYFPLLPLFFSILLIFKGKKDILILKKEVYIIPIFMSSLILASAFFFLSFVLTEIFIADPSNTFPNEPHWPNNIFSFLLLALYLVFFLATLWSILLSILQLAQAIVLHLKGNNIKDYFTFTIIALVILSTSIFSTLMSFQKMGLNDGVASIEEFYCEQIKKEGFDYYTGCYKIYKDGGKICSNNDDCEGLCIVTKKQLPGLQNIIKDEEKDEAYYNNIEYFKSLNNLKGICEYDEQPSDMVPSCTIVHLENGKIENSYIKLLEEELEIETQAKKNKFRRWSDAKICY